MTTKNKWKDISQQDIYENNWIKIIEHQVINPGGEAGIYGVVNFKNEAVAIVPIDNEMNTWIVGQFRFPTKTYEWEVPEGGKPENESILETAHRELLEETGIVASHLEIIAENLQLSNSTTNELGHVVLARGLSFHNSSPDVDEDLQIKKIPFTQLVEMAQNGSILDALSIISILLIDNYIKNNS